MFKIDLPLYFEVHTYVHTLLNKKGREDDPTIISLHIRISEDVLAYLELVEHIIQSNIIGGKFSNLIQILIVLIVCHKNRIFELLKDLKEVQLARIPFVPTLKI